MCYALHNSKPLDNNKNLFENNIKNNDTVLFIKIDENSDIKSHIEFCYLIKLKAFADERNVDILFCVK